MQDIPIESLTNEGIELLQMELDQLYATLGAQILGRNLPRRAAGIVSYLSAVRSASEAKTFYPDLPSENFSILWGKGMRTIYEGLKQDGIRHLDEIGPDLRKTLCTEEILGLSKSANPTAMQIVILVVSAALRMPREFDPILVTVSAILFKLGLHSFCGRSESNPSKNAQ